MNILKNALTFLKTRLLDLTWLKKYGWIPIVLVLLLFLNLTPLFTAVSDRSMEPALARGSLVVYSRTPASSIKPGDILVFKVASADQSKYAYPAVVSRRVVRSKISAGEIVFITRSEKSGEDPFQTREASVLGRMTRTIPLCGYPVTFARSLAGQLILAGLIVFYCLYRNRGSWLDYLKRARPIHPPVARADSVPSQSILEKKFENMSDRVVTSMNGFSSAMSEYAKHIASHTQAVKSLAEVAQHMESVLIRQEEALRENASPRSAQCEEPMPGIVRINMKGDAFVPIVPATAPLSQPPIEITPELKLAVKEFIFEYNLMHKLNKLEMTPDLRAAVWTFILNYVNKPLEPEPGSYLSAIKTIKITPESDLVDMN